MFTNEYILSFLLLLLSSLMAQWSLLGREPLLDTSVSPQFVTPVSAIGCALLIHFVDPFLPLSFLNETSTPVSLGLAQSSSYPIFLERIKQGERIFADETTLPTLAPGSGKTQKAWLWAYARDDRPFGGADPPMVAYRFEDSRSGDCVARHLAGFGGLLQVDGYCGLQTGSPKGAGANDGVTLAAWFAHVRRRFYELHVNESSHLATQTITTMAALWKVEEDIRGKDPATRVNARQEKSAAIVASLFELWETELPRLSGKIQTRRGDPLRHLQAGRSRTLPERWPCRNRFQHCRARHPTANNYSEKRIVRGIRRRWSDLGDRRHAFADRKNERGRSTRLAHADP